MEKYFHFRKKKNSFFHYDFIFFLLFFFLTYDGEVDLIDHGGCVLEVHPAGVQPPIAGRDAVEEEGGEGGIVRGAAP